MTIRIVKMTFHPENVENFKNLFSIYKDQIRHFPGCHYLQVLQDKDNPNIIFSYSHWSQISDLNNYRHSELFKKVWPKTKEMFSEAAVAWSTELVHDLQ